MFANYLIGLREGLEASLIVAILAAYLVRVNQRRALVRMWIGVAAAILLALGFGAFLELTSQALSFEAQETFGGVVSILAVALITWMVFWMARNARHLRGHLHGQIDSALNRSSLAIAVVAFVAVIREGLETALFLWTGISAAGSTASPIIGALLGIATAIAIGIGIYLGALKLNLARLFGWTGAALVVVAAGVLAYGVHDLQEAGILPGLNSLAFDVSEQVPPGSWYGALLKGTVNFSPATTWLELVVWLAYLIPTMALYVRVLRTRPVAAPAKERAHAHA